MTKSHKHTRPPGAESVSQAMSRAGLVPLVLPENLRVNVRVEVTYNVMPIDEEMTVKPDDLKYTPEIQLHNTHDQCLYTMVVVDADYPSPDTPTGREFVYLIVTNVPGKAGNSKHGDELLAHTPPGHHPGTGTHRFVVAAFEQHGHLVARAPKHRMGFSTKDFAQTYGLTPVGAMFFYSERAQKPTEQKPTEQSTDQSA